MTTIGLPPDGELQLGPIGLPPGRRIIPFEGTGEPAAWVTSRTVPRPGPVWSTLSGLHAETGLVPILLADDEANEDFFFYSPSEIAEVDRLDAVQVLAARWATMRAYAEHERDSQLQWGALLSRQFPELKRDERGRASWPPTGLPAEELEPFPGLAPRSDSNLSTAERDAAVGALPAARIGLVPARRPADVLAIVGWSTFDDPASGDEPRNGAWIAAVLRSWEDRFGARLLNVGPGAVIRLLVQRPPRSLEAARRIAAEHRVFADECAGPGASDIPSISASIVNSPIWTFWWD
jgi:hypothetical protein